MDHNRKKGWTDKLLAYEFSILLIAPLLKIWGFALSDISLGLPVPAALASWGTLLILSAGGVWFSRKGERRYRLALDVVISFLVWIDVMYWRYFGDVPSVATLAYANQTGAIFKMALGLIKPVDALLFLDLGVLGLARLVRHEARQEVAVVRSHLVRAAGRLLAGGVLVGLALVQLFYTLGGTGFQELLIYKRTTVVYRIGLLDYHILDIARQVSRVGGWQPALTPEDRRLVEEWYQEKQTAEPGQYFGIARGMNLIIVQVESLQNFPIGQKYRGQEITPNLNRLVGESLYFTDAHHQTADGSTSDAEFLLDTSLYPMAKGSVFFLKAGSQFRSLPSRLRQNGYYPVAFHAYIPTFWNRQEMYRSLGFERFVSHNDFKPGEKIGWGLGDKDFFVQVADILKTVPQPVYAQLVTLSSHGPFDGLKGMRNDFTVNRNEVQENLADYLEIMHYVDYALGCFVDQLKQKGLWENTVLVVYGDHRAIGGETVLNFTQAKESDEYHKWMAERIPLIIHVPSIKTGQVIDSPIGQVDLYPTILSLLGLEPTGAYMGEDVLGKDGTKDHLVIFRNGSYLSRKHYYVEGSAPVAYDRATGQRVPLEECRSETEEARKQLRISDILLDHPLEQILGR